MLLLAVLLGRDAKTKPDGSQKKGLDNRQALDAPVAKIMVSPFAGATSVSLKAVSMSDVMSFLPFVGVFAIMYFLLIRPQQQRQKQLRNELKSLRRGDRIVTAGGIIGVVQKSREDTNEVEVEIAPNVRVMVLRDTITTVLTSTAKPANDVEKAKK